MHHDLVQSDIMGSEQAARKKGDLIELNCGLAGVGASQCGNVRGGDK